jgi:hypothetical protein
MSDTHTANQPLLSTTNPSQSASAPFPWWLRTIVILGALLMTAGALIALLHPVLLVSPHDEINNAVHIYAGYLFSRNLAIAAMLLAALSLRARATLNTLMLLTAFIQLLDAIVDCFEARWPIVPGVAVLGLLFLLGAAALSGHPFWRKAAWTPAR